MSSDSETEGRAAGYQPIYVEKIKAARDAPSSPPPVGWPRDAMHVYTNDLFTEGEPEAGELQGAGKAPKAPAAMKSPLPQQRSTLAARRAERLQASAYTSNTSAMSRAPGTPTQSRPRAYSNHPHQGEAEQGDHVYGLRGTYDPNDENPQVRTYSPRAVPAAALDLSDMPRFLMQPGPKEGTPFMCYIVRDKGSAKMYPRYTLYLEDPKMFLLAARKRKKQTTSNYLVSLDPEDLNRDSAKFFGKLRANFVGTEFTLFDGGDKPDKKGDGGKHSGPLRQELGAVTYQYNVLGTRGPRKMTGIIPALTPRGDCLYQPRDENDNILDRLKCARGLDQLVIMRNKPPRWNDELNAYCLNFNGRVTEASVKNFQLVTDDEQNHVILQFGKIGKNTFTMDYMWPINAFQAFCICLSSFDGKLACE